MKNYYHSSCSHSRSMKKNTAIFLYSVKAHKKAAVKSRRFTESGCLVETFWSSSKINKQTKKQQQDFQSVFYTSQMIPNCTGTQLEFTRSKSTKETPD